MRFNLLQFLARLGYLDPRIWEWLFPHDPQVRQGYYATIRGLINPDRGLISPNRGLINPNHPVSTLGQAELNPQPIPPGVELQFATVAVSYDIANAAVAAEAAGSEGASGKIVSSAVDDFCGTGPHPIPWPRRWPFPWPLDAFHGRDGVLDREIGAVQFVAALVFGTFASRLSEGETRDALAEGADRLLEASLASVGEEGDAFAAATRAGVQASKSS